MPAKSTCVNRNNTHPAQPLWSSTRNWLWTFLSTRNWSSTRNWLWTLLRTLYGPFMDPFKIKFTHLKDCKFDFFKFQEISPRLYDWCMITSQWRNRLSYENIKWLFFNQNIFLKSSTSNQHYFTLNTSDI